jgi:hypothetical protein
MSMKESGKPIEAGCLALIIAGMNKGQTVRVLHKYNSLYVHAANMQIRLPNKYDDKMWLVTREDGGLLDLLVYKAFSNYERIIGMKEMPMPEKSLIRLDADDDLVKEETTEMLEQQA